MSKHFDWWHDDAKQFLGCHELIDEQILALVLILGAEERIIKNMHFLAHVHCRVQLRYLSELVGCDMLWSLQLHWLSKRSSPWEATTAHPHAIGHPFPEEGVKACASAMCGLSSQIKHRTVPKNHLFCWDSFNGWRVSNLAAPTHTPNLQQRYKTLHEPTQSSSFAISAANIPKLTKNWKSACIPVVRSYLYWPINILAVSLVFAETHGCPELLTSRLVHGKWPWSDSWVKGMGLIGLG